MLLSIACACLYGVLHDQITARICLEYFTVWHPHLIDSTDPTVVALAWGIAATWWVGLGLGVPLAWAAHGKKRRRVPISTLMPKMALLFGTMAGVATLCGIVGYDLAPTEMAARAGYEGEQVRGFLADLFAHNASYGVGIVGGIALIVWTYRESLRQPANL